MSKKFTKRALSLLIALALTISLLPSVVFAADGESVVVDFTTTTKDAETGVYSGTNYTLTSGILYSSSQLYTATKAKNEKAWMYGLQASSGGLKPWLDTDTSNFIIEIPVVTAGYYDIKLSGAKVSNGMAFYIYVDGEYAGFYDFYGADNTTNFVLSEKELNTLYLTPDSGKVEVMFAYAGATASNYYARMYINSLTFTKNDNYTEPVFDKIVENIPDTMIKDEEVELSIYVNEKSGEIDVPLRTNNYTSSKTESTIDFIDVEILSNDGVISLSDTPGYAFGANYVPSGTVYGSKHTFFNGTYNGTLTALAAGTATVKITAIVDGDNYSTTKTITVTDPNASIELKFNNTTLEDNDTTTGVKGNEVIATDAANFDVVSEKSTGYNVGPYSNKLRVDGGVSKDTTAGNATPWLWLDDKSNYYGAFTVKTKVSEGNYSVDFVGAKLNLAGMMYIYVDGQLVGLYDGYSATTGTYAAAPLSELISYGVVAVTPDDEGYIEIQFCSAAGSNGTDTAKYGNTDMLISSLTLTPTTEAASTLSSVSVKSGDAAIAESNTLDMGEQLTFTAEAVMSDSLTRHINGHTAEGELDPKNKVEVSVDGSSVEYDVVNYYVKDADTDNKAMYDANGIYTGKLTAVAPGTSTVTVTATVNGTVKSSAFTVSVPYTDTGATTIENTISYIVRAEDSANDDKVKVDSDTEYEIGEVGEWTVGESFTATAMGDGFAYWANGNGTPVSESPSYIFTPTSNFTLEAVYAPADTTTKKVQFWNYNKVYLGDKGVTDDNKVESMPEDPTLNGWRFTNWKTDANTVFTADTILTDVITRVVAQFTEVEDAFTIDGTAYDYDEEFTKIADDADGENAFSYWTIDGQVASYDKTLSFNVWDSVEVEAVYAGEKTAVPTVVLDKVDHTDSPDEYFILYEVPTGYTLVDAGIVFGTSGTTPTVRSTDGSKASAAKLTGQFTAAPGDDTHTAARGYVMYRDSYNNLRVLYTEVK